MVKTTEYPRLTNFLRAYSNVCAPWARDIRDDPDELVWKRKEIHAREAKNCSLALINNFILKNSTIDEGELLKRMKELKTLTREIVGDGASVEMVESSIVYMFEVFKDCEIIGQKHVMKLRRMFGTYPKSAVNKSLAIIKTILTELNIDALEEVVKNGFPKKQEDIAQEEFGSKIKFVPQEPLNECYYLLPPDTSSQRKETVNKLSFSLATNNGVSDSHVRNGDKSVSKRVIYDQSWLESELRKTMPNCDDSARLSPAELTTSAISILKSNKSNDELQNELFDLLGFARYELIQDIFRHRDTLKSSKIELQSDSKNLPKSSKESIPSYMCQVTVQSETEKFLSKQIRKDEKKIQKSQNNNVPSEDATVLDAKYMKYMRETQLAAAKNTPIFSRPQRQTERGSYPNVYDSFAEVSQTASFISGKKLHLPVNNHRVNNAQFEEISIPAVKRTNLLKRPLVPVNTLDKIGRQAFNGIEKLNLIQSMVFDIAYHSQDNMLVCAPTGAGKTNVAMLTVVHELRNNMVGGEIQKDKFKIVYVAPMKALASEVVRNFSQRLNSLGIKVKELTGDMQLTKREIMETQMLVTTPEKWDVVTRKSTGDVALTQLVKLLIIDEVHLLDGDRGPVLEALVARTLRQVETSQSMIRILGLSATLPNYVDVARFLRVNPSIGLFFFDDRFRPVPLSTTFIGIKAPNPLNQLKEMNEVCYEKVLRLVQQKHQVMVFVHARSATVRTACVFRELAQNKGQTKLFTDTHDTKEFTSALKQMSKSKNEELRNLFDAGFSIHHAGMARIDRNHVEKYFREGFIRCLVCTSTLAWGVNLPARAVIIKGTDIYDSKHGSFIDLGILDVMQIFGRAGRPQFDTEGEGTIITTHDKLSHYLSLLTRQHQIESNFINNLADNLNAEISLGTVTNVEEGVEWLSYTYLYIRMMSNPHAYGLTPSVLMEDFQLFNYRKQLIMSAAEHLDKTRMINYDRRNGYLYVADLGRTASHFYVTSETVNVFNDGLKYEYLTDEEAFQLIAKAKEFHQLKVREDEMPELDTLLAHCPYRVATGIENTEGKVNVLLQSYLNQERIESFSLTSDQAYVVQNSTRIVRFLFEVALRKGWALRTALFLKLSKMLERRLWDYKTPLWQFADINRSSLEKLDRLNLNIENLIDTPKDELAFRTRCGGNDKDTIYYLLRCIPNLIIEPSVQPITDKILRIRLSITPDFKWDDHIHGSGSEPFWLWIEEPDSDVIYHFEYFLLPKRQVMKREPQLLSFTIPLQEGVIPSQYLVHVVSDKFLGSDRTFPIDFQKLILPSHHQPQTELLDLHPLPVTALNNMQYQSIYKFDFFNPIQTQIFHTLYYTDCNVLLGAPTGSGKTIAAEIAMFRLFNTQPGKKAVYIAPLKALVRERIEDWKIRFEGKLQKKVVELTGDVTPDVKAIASADVIVTTPEKWDGVSRSWQTRNYVKAVTLMIIDEIHLLGEDRGPVLEVIVSRTTFISSHTDVKVRVIGLSTALANAQDLGNWLGIQEVGLYNFRPSVRPVPLEVHVAGYPGKHYCPRMAVMNKPTYQAIRTHSADQPALVFVSSRRQTRMTALDLIAYLAAEDNPRQWVHMADEEVEMIILAVRDQNLKLTIAFGIGLHHAGLHEKDRKLVEELFLHQKIQVLIATATLAWGVNLPAHLVIVKGTEYFDGKSHRYVDFPITDVLQMIGRAGRPQFDNQGVAVVLVQDIKKDFYKKFLYNPFPVESSLIEPLPDHINAEIVAGTITSRQLCLDYLTWTYFFRRLLQNPGYYGLENTEPNMVNVFLSGLVNRVLSILSDAYCINIDEEEQEISATVLGRIASYYYLNHRTMITFRQHLSKSASINEVLKVLCDAQEYEELPVRHNEDTLNEQLAKECPVKVDPYSYDNPHTKAHLLFQAHFSRLSLPCSDYYTDLKSVLDQAIRIVQAMIDVSSDRGWLATAIKCMSLLQMILQARWYNDCSLLTLRHVGKEHLFLFRFGKDSTSSKAFKQEARKRVDCLPELIDIVSKRYELLASVLREEMDENQINDIFQTLISLPVIEVSCSLKGKFVDVNGSSQRNINFMPISGVRPQSSFIKTYADDEYILNINLKRLSKSRRDTKAFAPKFPKPKDEGWFLILGIIDTGELVAMKRIPYIQRNALHNLVFYTPDEDRQVIYTLFLISDSYIGLDQQFDICLNVHCSKTREWEKDKSSSSDSDESIFISEDEDFPDE